MADESGLSETQRHYIGTRIKDLIQQEMVQIDIFILVHHAAVALAAL